jgi:hypothetical protein
MLSLYYLVSVEPGQPGRLDMIIILPAWLESSHSIRLPLARIYEDGVL